MVFADIFEAMEDYQAGKFVLIVDDDDRENEGDVAIAAEHITPEAVNFMTTHCRGLICMPITGERLDELHIPLMVPKGHSIEKTAFTVSIDGKKDVATGISAFDRATTVKMMLDPSSGPEDFVRPGHLFPLRYTEGGVLRRPGHTEASVDLAKLAGLYPAAVICEVMRKDGTMARLPDLKSFALKNGMKIISVEQIVEYRRRTERTMVARVPDLVMPRVVSESLAYA